jgi:L-threonylcarbamoyladenylate synthase
MLFRIDPDKIDLPMIGSVAKIALAGEMVIFPTDTIYGIGTSAHSQAGIMRLFSCKRRALTLPVGIFVDGFEMLDKYCVLNESVSSFLEKIWPGPVTCVLSRNLKTQFYTTPTKTQLPTVAVRIPKNPVTNKLVSLMKEALLETSINYSNQPFLTWEDLLQSYERYAQMMISSGREKDDKPSTILDLSGQKVKLLRQGSYAWDDLKNLLAQSGLEIDESTTILA